MININQANNITTMESIKNKRGERTPHEAINLIINNDIAESSKNTATSYLTALDVFLNYAFDKNIGTVTWEELENVTYDIALSFRAFLQSQKKEDDRRVNKYAVSTINQRMFALSSLFQEIEKINPQVNAKAFNIKRLKSYGTDNSYGALTEDEVERLFQYCLDLPQGQKPIIKQLFFEIAYVTAIRSGALLKLTWKNISQKKDVLSGEVYNIIRTEDKGKEVKVPISDELYSRLMLVKELNKELGIDENRVFPITQKTLAKCLKEFCETDGISEDRNIVLHSLKKASIDKVYKETGDVNVTARHGHHSSLEMVYKHYQGKNDGLASSPSLTVFSSEGGDMEELEELTKEELLELISGCNKNVIDSIMRTKREKEGR